MVRVCLITPRYPPNRCGVGDDTELLACHLLHRVRAIAGPYGKAWFAVMLLASARIILTNEQDEWRFLQQRLRYPVPASRYSIIPVGSNLPTVSAPQRKPGMAGVTLGYFGFVNPA